MPASSSASRDAPVDVVLRGRQLERGEEDARHTPVDVLPAQLPRALLLRCPPRVQAAPDERVLARERRGHHALADRLEDLGLAEIGNRAVRTRARPSDTRRVRRRFPSPARRSTRPARLQIAHGAPDRDARRPEPALELRLARQAVAVASAGPTGFRATGPRRPAGISGSAATLGHG